MDRRKHSPAAGGKVPPPADAAGPAGDLGARLRSLFEAVEAAPVPDEISRLVIALEAKRTRRGDRSN